MFTFNDDTATTTTEHFSVGWDWVEDERRGGYSVGVSDKDTIFFITNLVILT
jgi:glutathionylspermidine synthase